MVEALVDEAWEIRAVDQRNQAVLIANQLIEQILERK